MPLIGWEALSKSVCPSEPDSSGSVPLGFKNRQCFGFRFCLHLTFLITGVAQLIFQKSILSANEYSYKNDLKKNSYIKGQQRALSVEVNTGSCRLDVCGYGGNALPE